MADFVLHRRDFLNVTVASGIAALHPLHAAGAESKDVPWLKEIQTPPARLPATNIPKLEPLLQNADGKAITTTADWEVKRAELRRKWLEFLGPAPCERNPMPKVEVIEEENVGDVVRRLIRYEVEPGLVTEAYWMQPKSPAAKCPGAVVFHSTANHTIRQPAGLGDDLEKAFGLKLAQRGFITVSPRNFLWPGNEKIAAKEEAQKYIARKPGSTGMQKMLHDAQVATDVLVNLPHVDATRLCSVGHSLGAKEVLYLAAFDDRMKVTVSSEGGIGTKFSNWEAVWYLGDRIKAPDFKLEHHELLGMIAPRPFLLLGGNSADGDRGWPFIEAALPVYKLYGEPSRIGQYNHKKGHAVPPEAEQKIYEWIETYT